MDGIGDFFWGSLLGVGAGAAGAFAVIKFWAESWIGHRFSKDLESAKAEISLHAAERIRLRDRQYEIFPEIWAQLNDLMGKLNDCLFDATEIKSFGQLPDRILEEWVNEGGDGWDYAITDEQREKFNSELSAIVNDCLPAYQSFCKNNYIFLAPAIKKTLHKINGLLSEVCSAAWENNQRGFQHNGYDSNASAEEDRCQEENKKAAREQREKAIAAYRNMVALMDELENAIQDKLHPDDVRQ